MSTRRARTPIAMAVLVTALAGCDSDGTAPSSRLDMPVAVSASLAGSAVEWLSVEVTAADIAVPLVVTLAATGGVAHGTVTVPSGVARTFTARGYDTEGTLTHRAVTTVDVTPGTGVSLALRPVTDAGTPSYADDRVALSATDVSLAAGGTQRLTATVTHADGSAAAGAAVQWATLDAAIATVSPAGLVTAIAPGSTQVVALSGGGAGVANVVVR